MSGYCLRRAAAARRPVSRRVGALAGLAPGCSPLGVAEMVAALTGPSSEPLVAVGDAFVDLHPALAQGLRGLDVRDVRQAGPALGAEVVVAALGALAGVVGRAGAVPGTVAGPRAGGGRGDRRRHPAGRDDPVRPAQRGRGDRRHARPLGAGRPAGDGEPPGLGADRRAVLRTGASWPGRGAVALGAGRLLGSAPGTPRPRAATSGCPRPPSPEPPLPAGVEVGVAGVDAVPGPGRGLLPDRHRLVVPRVRAEDWELRIHGMVDREVALDFADAAGAAAGGARRHPDVRVQRGRRRPHRQRRVAGPADRPLLRQAGPHADADMVLSTSVDGFTAATPLGRPHGRPRRAARRRR